VDRSKCGTAVHLACDARAMPLGVVVTGANANDGCQTEAVLKALVVGPPAAQGAGVAVELRSLPRVQADGAYGNGPTQDRARRAGFRLQAPTRGKAQPGVGKIRNAVERCHNFFAQFGRIFRRFDRSARHYLGWLELAACIILLRSGFVS
jgi:transposase